MVTQFSISVLQYFQHWCFDIGFTDVNDSDALDSDPNSDSISVDPDSDSKSRVFHKSVIPIPIPAEQVIPILILIRMLPKIGMSILIPIVVSSDSK